MPHEHRALPSNSTSHARRSLALCATVTAIRINYAMPTKPLSTDAFDILLGHDRWATAQIIDRCRPLTEAQFHQQFPIGPGSLHDTIAHIIGAMHRWADRIGERPLRPRLDGRTSHTDPAPAKRFTAAEFSAQLQDIAPDFAHLVAQLRDHGTLNTTRTWTIADYPPETFTVAAAVIHVTNHGMHHRAQCMNMLRHLGRPVNADLDELEWQIAEEP